VPNNALVPTREGEALSLLSLLPVVRAAHHPLLQMLFSGESLRSCLRNSCHAYPWTEKTLTRNCWMRSASSGRTPCSGRNAFMTWAAAITEHRPLVRLAWLSADSAA
jgi:hypothetical protein